MRPSMTSRAVALLALLASKTFSKGTVLNLARRSRDERTPEQVQWYLDRAAARRKRKAAFRLNQANYTNIRVRRQMV